jgi:hypothetical protein
VKGGERRNEKSEKRMRERVSRRQVLRRYP